MALPTSGPISLAQIRTEFGGPYSMAYYYRGGGYTTGNNINVPTSGKISLSQFYGAVKAVPGSLSYGPGVYYYAIPPFAWITFDVRAGGGGGGSVSSGHTGGAGGTSQVYGGNINVSANGGSGGAAGIPFGPNNYLPDGTPRAADGWGNQGAGGGYGGQSGSQSDAYGTTIGQDGGYGGRSVVTYYAGQLVVGATMTIVVGGGGAGGSSNGVATAGSAGGGGATYISWG